MPRLHQMESLLLVVVSVVNVKMNKNIHKTTKIFLRIKMCQLSSFLVLSAFSFSSSFDLNIFLKSDRTGFCTLLLLEMIATEISNTE